MKNIKKAVVLLVSVLVILAVANATFASTIQPRNTTDENVTNTENEPTNVSNTANSVNNTTNNVTNNVVNNLTTNSSQNNTISNGVSPINTTNTTQNIPHTGIEDTYLNFALFLLLAVVLGMFSLVQYNRIVKKEE